MKKKIIFFSKLKRTRLSAIVARNKGPAETVIGHYKYVVSVVKQHKN